MSRFRLNLGRLFNRPVFNAIATIASALLGAIILDSCIA